MRNTETEKLNDVISFLNPGNGSVVGLGDRGGVDLLKADMLEDAADRRKEVKKERANRDHVFPLTSPFHYLPY